MCPRRRLAVECNADDSKISGRKQRLPVASQPYPPRKAADEPAGDDPLRWFVEGDHLTAQEVGEVDALARPIISDRAHPQPNEPLFLDATSVVVDFLQQTEVWNRRVDLARRL